MRRDALIMLQMHQACPGRSPVISPNRSNLFFKSTSTEICLSDRCLPQRLPYLSAEEQNSAAPKAQEAEAGGIKRAGEKQCIKCKNAMQLQGEKRRQKCQLELHWLCRKTDCAQQITDLGGGRKTEGGLYQNGRSSRTGWCSVC